MTRLFNTTALRCIAVISLVFSPFVVPAPAFGQSEAAGDALSVSPPTAEVDGAPGQVVTQKVTIDNVSKFPRTIQVNIENFHASGEEGAAELDEGQDAPNTLKTWIKVSPNKVTIPPNGSQAFEVKIDIPKSASPGGHFAALVFEPGVDNSNPEANVKVVSRVTSLVLLRLPGDATEKASIASFTASKPNATPGEDGQIPKTGFFQKGPVDFHVRVKNEGNIQIKPQITVEVRNLFGAKIATLTPEDNPPIKSESAAKAGPRNVLPDSVRRIDLRWDHKQLFGLYKAKTIVKYGNSQQTVESTTSFYAAPLVTVGIGFGVLMALVVLIWLPRKRLRKAFKALASSGD